MPALGTEKDGAQISFSSSAAVQSGSIRISDSPCPNNYTYLFCIFSFFPSFPLLTILSLFVSFDDVTYNPATRFFPVLLFGNTTYYIMVEINSILDTKFNFSVILRMILLPLSLSFSFTLSFTFNYSSSCISLNILYRKRIVHKELRPIGIVCER